MHSWYGRIDVKPLPDPHIPAKATAAMRGDIACEHDRADWERHNLAGALVEVEAAIHPTYMDRSLAGEGPLAAACRLVADAQGIEFPVGLAVAPGENLDGIADRIGFAYRDVALRGDWYRRDGGPLLAWSADGAPLALIRQRGHYWCRDPGADENSRVDAARAAGISPRGTTLYRRIPQTAGIGRGLLREAMVAGKGQGKTLIFATAAIAMLSLALPIASGILFGATTASADGDQLAAVTACLLALIVGRTIYSGIISLTMLRLETRIEQAMFAGVWDRLLRLPVPFFRQYLIGDLYQRSEGSIELSRTGATIPPAMLAALGSSLSGLLMILIGGWPGILCMIVIVLVYGLAASGVLATRGLVKQWRDAGARLSGFSIQLIQLIAKLKVGGAERRAFAVWARHYAPLAKASRRAEERLAGTSLLVGELPFLLGAVAFCAIVTRPGMMDLADFVAFSVAMGQFAFATGSLFAKLETMLTLHRVLARMRPLLAEPPEAGQEQQVCGHLAGRVEFAGVCFSYDPGAAPLLETISFTVEPGQMFAIVGPSGAGKSTLARLLLGFAKPGAGSILLDGRDIAGLDPRQMRAQMGVVLQHSGLTGASLYQNIAAGTGLSLDDAWEAVAAVGLADDIRAMPMGMNTRINENGSLLSGGQCQRLMLARAIARRPRILLLDEATSALDNITQDVIAANLAALGMTRIIIAHRLSTVRQADRIIVMDGGRIRESGSYHELMARGDLFAQLSQRQQIRSGSE